MMKSRIQIGQIVHARTPLAPKNTAIVVGVSKTPGQIRICRWRGAQQHWSLPASVDAARLVPIVDWTLMPLTEAKRLAAAAFERNYLVRAMETARGSVVDAARSAGVDRSNFRRLLQRHALVKLPTPSKRWPKRGSKRQMRRAK